MKSRVLRILSLAILATFVLSLGQGAGDWRCTVHTTACCAEGA